MTDTYDALFLIAFGGPEGMDDVIPFLENVLRGRNVPRERMLEVAHHYEQFNGVSPINQQMRDLLAALKPAMERAGIELPVYWGNRNWDPYIDDVVEEMKADGIQKALGFVVSAYSSYSGCRQYRENVIEGCQKAGTESPHVDKVRVFYNHPLFIQANVDRLHAAIEELPVNYHSDVKVAFTAHSLPISMANSSDYVQQLTETCRLVAGKMGLNDEQWDLVYQSRSGRPQDPWLEPDIIDHLENLRESGHKSVIIAPIGFLSDHMEILFDLDTEAREYCEEHEMTMIRAKTVGTHPDFIQMIVELIQERLDPTVEKRAIGQYGPNHDVCPVSCCPAPPRRPVPAS